MADSQADPVADAARAPAIRFILVCVLIDVIGIGLAIPVLPDLVGEFTANRQLQALWYGALGLAFGAAQFLCAPLLGALSDRFGRRPVLLVAIGAMGFMFLASALVQSVQALLAARIVGGALAANFAVASAYVADLTAPERRAAAFGKIGAAFGAGFVLGPALGGVLGQIDIRLPFYAAALLSAANWLYGCFVLPESLPRERRGAVAWRKTNPFTALIGLARLRGVGGLVAVIALTDLAQFVVQATWVLYTGFRFAWGPAENGWSLFAVGIVVVLVQGFLLKRLLANLGERRLVLWGLLSGTIAFVGYGLAPYGWLLVAIIAANVMAFAVEPTLEGSVSRAVDPLAQGQAMGALAGLGSLMGVLAPPLGSGLLAAVSHLPAHDWRLGAPYFLAAALQLAALLLAWLHFAGRRAAAGAAATAATAPVAAQK
jgi:DHA1 family tetracycline resistance protein-like MFS transporter